MEVVASRAYGVIGRRFSRRTVQDVAPNRLQTLGLFRDCIVVIHSDEDIGRGHRHHDRTRLPAALYCRSYLDAKFIQHLLSICISNLPFCFSKFLRYICIQIILCHCIPRHPSLILILHVGHGIDDGVVIPGTAAVSDFYAFFFCRLKFILKLVGRLRLRLDRGYFYTKNRKVLLKGNIGANLQAGTCDRAAAGRASFSVARLPLVEVPSRVLQVLEIRRRLQHRQHLRLRPGDGLALVAHERTVIVAVHRRQREV